MENIEKLPKWAQSRILVAENRLKEMERLMERRVPTKVYIRRYTSEVPIYLPDDRGIVFSLPSGEVEARIKEDGLEVRSCFKSMSIFPHVSNVVTIKPEDR